MLKADELKDPNSCLNKAKPKERVFVLLGRDDAAPETVRYWARARVRLGKNTLYDSQITEALDCANCMAVEYDGESAMIPVNRDASFNQHSSVWFAGNALTDICHGRAKEAGWWHDKNGMAYTDMEWFPFFVASKLMLAVSELAEGMEGHRKGLKDDHLPHRDMLEVELADCVIRCFDLAGALGYKLGDAMTEKMAYNAQRADHKFDTRNAEGGKKY